MLDPSVSMPLPNGLSAGDIAEWFPVRDAMAKVTINNPVRNAGQMAATPCKIVYALVLMEVGAPKNG